MKTVNARDLAGRLDDLLDAVSTGGRVLIERDGRPVAVLVPPEAAATIDDQEQERVERGLAALDRLAAFADRMSARGGDPPDAALTAAEVIREDREDRTDQVLRAAGGRRDEPAVDDVVAPGEEVTG